MKGPIDDGEGEERTDLEGRLDGLPTLPGVVMRLLSLDHTSETLFEDVRRVLHSDPPYAMRVLRMANSAAACPAEPIVSIAAALASIGTVRAIRAVTSAAVAEVFVAVEGSQRDLWLHSIQTALLAQWITRRCAPSRIAPETAYLAGLLHDIGRFVLYRDSPLELKAVDHKGWRDLEGLVRLEREEFGFDHAEAGARLCERWSIPEPIAFVIRYHHTPPAELPGTPFATLTQIIQVADALSILSVHDPRYAVASTAARQAVIARKALALDELGALLEPQEVVDYLNSSRDEVEVLLGFVGLH